MVPVGYAVYLYVEDDKKMKSILQALDELFKNLKNKGIIKDYDISPLQRAVEEYIRIVYED